MTGKELQQFRKSLKLSQSEFCNVLGVKTRTVSSLEKSENIGILYTNAVKFLMIQQQSERLHTISQQSSELIEILQ